MLSIENVSKTYGKGAQATTVLKDINLQLAPGEIVALYGPSGSGKSTLLSIVGALLTPSCGDITLDGRAWRHLTDNERTDMRLKDIGFIFQSSHLLPYLTVKEQLTAVGSEAGQSKKEASARAEQLLTSFGLGHRLSAHPKELSGGEKQRTAIARAFMNKPKLILADEPTASLDKERASEVVDMLRKRVKESGAACIMITHDQRLFSYTDKTYYLEDGYLTLAAE
ncbi:ABC transporter ATP-binding protein [Macrococcus equipercicus]|uniref:Putative hemin import ATP-binding protein HrtA n=1 Tax=Macrococcus equipercicus TaxID=69967 RepID=A0ABQ6RBY2_9STAP|nr:ABC transporter ATP-binding protein [Macrococcus equipercicus]KAA1042753.1 ABC transporter ATP-binding protein [Macrococcus equipercicus]